MTALLEKKSSSGKFCCSEKMFCWIILKHVSLSYHVNSSRNNTSTVFVHVLMHLLLTMCPHSAASQLLSNRTYRLPNKVHYLTTVSLGFVSLFFRYRRHKSHCRRTNRLFSDSRTPSRGQSFAASKLRPSSRMTSSNNCCSCSRRKT